MPRATLSGTVSAGMRVVDARQRELAAGVSIEHERGDADGRVRYRTQLQGEVARATAGPTDAANVKVRQLYDVRQLSGGGRRPMRRPDYWLSIAVEIDRDTVRGVTSELVYAVGLSYDVPRSSGLSVSVDLRNSREHFSDRTEFNSVMFQVRQSFYHVWTVAGSGSAAGDGQQLRLVEEMAVTDSLQTDGAVQLRQGLSVDIPIRARWSLTASLRSNYMQNVPHLYPRRVSRAGIGISYRLGK